MPMNGDIVTLRNRTEPLRPLEYQFDGRTYLLARRDNPILFEHLRFAKDQNPVMGTMDQFDIRVEEHLVGVVAPEGERQKDDISPIAQSDIPERLRRAPGEHVRYLRNRARTAMSDLAQAPDGQGNYRPAQPDITPADVIAQSNQQYAPPPLAPDLAGDTLAGLEEIPAATPLPAPVIPPTPLSAREKKNRYQREYKAKKRAEAKKAKLAKAKT